MNNFYDRYLDTGEETDENVQLNGSNNLNKEIAIKSIYPNEETGYVEVNIVGVESEIYTLGVAESQANLETVSEEFLYVGNTPLNMSVNLQKDHTYLFKLFDVHGVQHSEYSYTALTDFISGVRYRAGDDEYQSETDGYTEIPADTSNILPKTFDTSNFTVVFTLLCLMMPVLLLFVKKRWLKR